MFSEVIIPQQKKMNLREAVNIGDLKHFKIVKDKSAELVDTQLRKERQLASITPEDIEESLKETIVQRVTPLAHLPYAE